MNEQELDALPDRAVVLDGEGDVWQKLSGEWWSIVASLAAASIDLVNDSTIAPVTLLHPVPEPDHSMCARLTPHPDDPKNRHGLQSPNGSYLTLPDDGPVFVAPDDYWRERGYAIPVPEPTVVERAAEVLGDILGHGDEPELARALADAGLLVRDGEQ